MNARNVSNDNLKSLQWGMHDAIVNGEIVRDVPSKTVYVTQKSELSNFADAPVGTIAATYGFTAMWHKKPDGTWANM